MSEKCGEIVSMLFDSDVIIWLLRKNQAAAAAIDSADSVEMSVITSMEVIRGLRDRREMREVQYTFADYGFQTIPLTEGIGHRAALYAEEYRLAIGVSDALIAATAVEHGLVLCTANTRHYRVVKGLEIYPFHP